MGESLESRFEKDLALRAYTRIMACGMYLGAVRTLMAGMGCDRSDAHVRVVDEFIRAGVGRSERGGGQIWPVEESLSGFSRWLVECGVTDEQLAVVAGGGTGE